ncbi:hypothetical protein YPPY08_3147, partial [Yersinia pestis PY-08]
MRASLR